MTTIADHIDGHCSFSELALDLSIHANDSLERKSAHEQFVLPPKLTVALILEGDLDAAMDDQPLCITSRNGPAGHLWLNPGTVRLDRWTRSGQRIRKIIVSLPFDRFHAMAGPAEHALLGTRSPADTRALLLRWTPNAQSLRYAEEIFAADPKSSALATLGSAAAALGLIHQAIGQNRASGTTPPAPNLNTRDARRARALRDYLIAHIDSPLQIETLAKEIGMSVRNLQRIFKSAYGATVTEFVRTRRLELARLSLLEEGVSVSEAAYRSGYSSSANFSTAFQREFGYPPSACLHMPRTRATSD